MVSYGRVIVVMGSQYGSEGKGAITEYFSPVVSVGVRTGASNAGHTIYFKDKKFVMHQVPCTWVNPNCKLVIGRGALISLDVLLQEIELVEKFLPIKNRLFVDADAFVITDEQIDMEKNTDLASRIGSTSATSGRGIGVSQAEKILRSENCLKAKNVLALKPYLADTVDMINSNLDLDQIVLLEGTQGFHLSLDFGSFPYVTSRNITAMDIAASCGVALYNFDYEVVGVTRTYPIRVAGNSGPFGDDSKEVDWSYVTTKSGAKKFGQSIVERTSVTNNIRRVATFSMKDFLEFVKVNRPTQIALTFSDYLDWSCHEKLDLTEPIINFIDLLENKGGVSVTLVKTGPKNIIDFNLYRSNIIRRVAC